jgi:hypothetical protein
MGKVAVICRSWLWNGKNVKCDRIFLAATHSRVVGRNRAPCDAAGYNKTRSLLDLVAELIRRLARS